MKAPLYTYSIVYIDCLYDLGIIAAVQHPLLCYFYDKIFIAGKPAHTTTKQRIVPDTL